MVECRDGSLYTGITNDLERRLSQHNDGTGARYTRSRRPVQLRYQELCENRSAALVTQYGEVVLAAPPRRGLNLLAWWGPYAALLAGAVTILLLGAAWTRRPAPQMTAPTSALSPEQRQLLEEELKKFDA